MVLRFSSRILCGVSLVCLAVLVVEWTPLSAQTTRQERIRQCVREQCTESAPGTDAFRDCAFACVQEAGDTQSQPQPEPEPQSSIDAESERERCIRFTCRDMAEGSVEYEQCVQQCEQATVLDPTLPMPGTQSSPQPRTTRSADASLESGATPEPEPSFPSRPFCFTNDGAVSHKREECGSLTAHRRELLPAVPAGGFTADERVELRRQLLASRGQEAASVASAPAAGAQVQRVFDRLQTLFRGLPGLLYELAQTRGVDPRTIDGAYDRYDTSRAAFLDARGRCKEGEGGACRAALQRTTQRLRDLWEWIAPAVRQHPPLRRFVTNRFAGDPFQTEPEGGASPAQQPVELQIPGSGE